MSEVVYELKLHEGMVAQASGNCPRVDLVIVRVPGGWLYNETFVPLNYEFKQREKSRFQELVENRAKVKA